MSLFFSLLIFCKFDVLNSRCIFWLFDPNTHTHVYLYKHHIIYSCDLHFFLVFNIGVTRQEFKFNPNAKSFIPSQTLVRPPSPASDGSFYFQTNVSSMPKMHMPMGVGVSALRQTYMLCSLLFLAQISNPSA